MKNSFKAIFVQKKQNLRNCKRKTQNRPLSYGVRNRLIRAYGEEKGRKITYAKTFEQSPYSRTVSLEEFQAILDGDL